MGQRDGFSSYDIGKINRMYECNRKPWHGYGLTGIGSVITAGAAINSPTRRPSSNFASIHSTSGTNTAGGREDHNPFRELFKAYTSPQFWQRLFGAWFFSQPQPRHYHQQQQQQQIYSDSPYTHYPYFFDQRYYG